ncbi:HEAT repeat domain-containing protein [Kribbella sp. DT2]|uniref:HEAT repeat domain-containing protein n=1 Tax=Kribbella sp. DT2 TaxID=3393427 RepID=UPI003CF4B21F
MFGFGPEHVELLVGLVGADWHVKHEDVVAVLGRFQDPAAVDPLYHATWWVPAYLEFDENRALARKAVRALGAVPGQEALAALQRVLDSEDAVVREFAVRELARQGGQR